MTLKSDVLPYISVDCVVFGYHHHRLHVLLIEQKALPSNASAQFTPMFALPGDLVKNDESLDDAAQRVLHELTGLHNIFLKQFYTFGNPNRVNEEKDHAWLEFNRALPDARVITVGYYSLIKASGMKTYAGSFAARVVWRDVEDIPDLAFDHNDIFERALHQLRMDIEKTETLRSLLPDKFTLRDLQNLYELILGKSLDKRNFRKSIKKNKDVIALNEKQEGVSHKPAELFSLNS